MPKLCVAFSFSRKLAMSLLLTGTSGTPGSCIKVVVREVRSTELPVARVS